MLGAILGGVSALSGIFGSNSAAKAQEAAADKQLDLARETRDLTRADLNPWLSAGNNALAAYNYELGIGPRPTFGGNQLSVEVVPGSSGRPEVAGSVPAQWDSMSELAQAQYRRNHPDDFSAHSKAMPDRYSVGGKMFDNMAAAQNYARENSTAGTEYGGYKASPGYDYQLEQGVNALDMSAAARGGLYSGATGKAVTQFGQDIGASYYNNYLNRLSGQASSGQNAAAQSGAANQFASQQATNALGNIGNAQAAGAVGTSNAIQGGINNLVGWMGYNQSQGNNAFGGSNMAWTL